jgi:hypothetical protein
MDMISQDSQSGAFSPERQNISLNPALRLQLEAIAAARGYLDRPEILYAAIKGWTVLQGVVSLEVFGHLSPLLPDAGALFDQEIMELLHQFGYPVSTGEEGR